MKLGGVELIVNEKNRKVFKTTCDCADPLHNLQVEIERIKLDKNDDILSLYFVHNTDAYVPSDLSFLKRVKEKFKLCLKIIKTEPIDFTGEFIFRDFNHARDFVDAIYSLAAKLKR